MKDLKRISQEKFDSLKKDEKDLLLIYYNAHEKENKLSKSLIKTRKKTKKIKERLNNIQVKKKEIMEKIKSINKSLFTTSLIDRALISCGKLKLKFSKKSSIFLI